MYNNAKQNFICKQIFTTNIKSILKRKWTNKVLHIYSFTHGLNCCKEWFPITHAMRNVHTQWQISEIFSLSRAF